MTFTKEQLQHIIETDHVQCGDSSALARMALAGMEAEPVGVTDKSEIECLKRGEMANVMPPDYKGCDVGDSVCLYTAPQPLSTSERAELENYRNAQRVVPGDVSGPLEHAYKELTPQFMRNHLSVFERYGTLVDGLTGIQAMRIATDLMERRAAMLQGAEQQQNQQQNIPENIPGTLFKPVADLYGITSPTGSETSFTFDAVEARDFIDGGWSCQEYVELERFQEAVSGNSPVIPDGYVLVPEEPTHEMLEAGDDQFGTYDVYRRMIAAAPLQEVK